MTTMRDYINLLEAQLLELNVVNVPAVEKKVAAIATKIENPAAKKWFTSAARNLILNDRVYHSDVRPLSTSPEWMQKGFKKGDVTYFHGYIDDLEHVVDWLNSLNTYANMPSDETGSKRGQFINQLINDAKKYNKSVNTLNLKDLVEKKIPDKWFANIKKIAEFDESGTELVKDYGDGYKWVILKTENALKREGSMMSHCVGGAGYTKGVLSGRTRIYSLRDEMNVPHTTIEVGGKKLQQIKGKENTAPVKKYIPYVLDFLNTNYAQITIFKCNDMTAAGIVKTKNGFIQDESKLTTRKVRDRPAEEPETIIKELADGYYVALDKTKEHQWLNRDRQPPSEEFEGFAPFLDNERSEYLTSKGDDCEGAADPVLCWRVVDKNVIDSIQIDPGLKDGVGIRETPRGAIIALVDFFNSNGYELQIDKDDRAEILALGLAYSNDHWYYVGNKLLLMYGLGYIAYENGYTWVRQNSYKWNLHGNRSNGSGFTLRYRIENGRVKADLPPGRIYLDEYNTPLYVADLQKIMNKANALLED